MIYAIISAFLIMAVSLSGKLFTHKKYSSWTDKNLHYLISFSIGVFLVTISHLFIESIEIQGLLKTVLLSAFGVITLFAISNLIPKSHHHHSTHTDHKHSKIDARRVLISDALHNIGDGLLLIPAFAISLEVGIIATIGILIHELVQEISEFFVLKESGYSDKKALLLNFLTSSTIFIGILISAFFAHLESVEGIILSLSLGGFIFITAKDLIPHTIHSAKHDKVKKPYIIAFILGLLIMGSISLLTPHVNEHEENLDGQNDDVKEHLEDIA